MPPMPGLQVDANIKNFVPIDHASVTIAATNATANIGINIPLLSGPLQPAIRLVNGGADVVFVRWGQAALVASVPAGATKGDMMLPANSVTVIPVTPAADGSLFVACICLSATATLHIAPGYGS